MTRNKLLKKTGIIARRKTKTGKNNRKAIGIIRRNKQEDRDSSTITTIFYTFAGKDDG